MKKLFFLFAMLLTVSAAFAFDTNLVYGFKQQDSADGYQQYVGKSFFVRPAYGSLETWRKSGFEYDKSYDGKTFTITKVTVKDVKLNDKPNKEVTIVAVQDGAKNKIKFKGYEEVSVKVSIWTGVKQWPLIGFMPVVFTEPFNEYKQTLLGNTITHEMVKDQYEIVDVFIGNDGKDKDASAATNVIVKNKRTGKTVTCPYSNVKTKPFEDALKGSYKTALVKVEKPEDATNRYGETKVIQDAGVDKYSYNDSIIDITIYGTKEEFKFTLQNISNHSLKLIWDEAVFVGLDGATSKVMHVGVKYSEREKSQPASVIIKGAKIDDLATPTANVYYDEGTYLRYSGKTIGSGWKTKSMLPSIYRGKDAGRIRLMLPIQVKDVVNEYTFVFKVYYTYDHPELLNADKL
ncbi:MAG: hypothetical protein IJ710_03355 [Prevotella sp.]|nr:hypothetical protein [Prevotella sp.]